MSYYGAVIMNVYLTWEEIIERSGIGEITVAKMLDGPA